MDYLDLMSLLFLVKILWAPDKISQQSTFLLLLDLVLVLIFGVANYGILIQTPKTCAEGFAWICALNQNALIVGSVNIVITLLLIGHYVQCYRRLPTLRPDHVF